MVSTRLRLPLLLLATWLGCQKPPSGAPGASSLGDGARASAPTAPTFSGSVEGRVHWAGRPVVPALLDTTASVLSVCGNHVADNGFTVDGTGGVADVVVWVESAPEPAPAGGPAVLLDQRGCLYWPSILAARAGATLRIRNSEPLTHTVHGRQGGETLFNLAMPLERMELSRQLPRQPGVVDIRCDVHPWMHAVVRTFDHPYFTTTDTAGHFRLAGLAQAEVSVHAWHPRLGEAVRRLKLGEGATAADFEFNEKP